MFFFPKPLSALSHLRNCTELLTLTTAHDPVGLFISTSFLKDLERSGCPGEGQVLLFHFIHVSVRGSSRTTRSALARSKTENRINIMPEYVHHFWLPIARKPFQGEEPAVVPRWNGFHILRFSPCCWHSILIFGESSRTATVRKYPNTHKLRNEWIRGSE